MARNHIIDPTFFYELINRFSFTYDFYVKSGQTVDEAGYQHCSYTKQSIEGSLQVQDYRRHVKKDGSIDSIEYNFYCKSLYRVKEGDFIFANDQWMICDGFHPYDEYGVREAHFKVIQLTAYNDLHEYVKFLQGKEIV